MIENLEEKNNELKKEQKILEEEMYEKCIKMNKQRTNAAQELSKKINQELEDLEMKNAQFKAKVDFDNNEKEFQKNGLNAVEFLIATNVGE